MTEGRARGAATACFGTVTARLRRLFRRLPKGHLGSEQLQALQRVPPEAGLARGRSMSLWLGVLRGRGEFWGLPHREGGAAA